ncbi:MAG: hypothetical protein ABR502_06350 [Chitinophagaceae bacterium]
METKIHFSQPEIELLSNAEIILTKNNVLQKVKNLLQYLQQQMINHVNNDNDFSAQHTLFATPPKISKGENYLGLPYLVLDYPRNFTPENIFAVRSLFWWGNFFSITLHLSGRYKTQFAHKMVNAFEQLAHKDYYININEDQWHHHFEASHVILIKQMASSEFKRLCNENDHLKISTKWPIIELDSVTGNILNSWKLFLSILLS